ARFARGWLAATTCFQNDSVGAFYLLPPTSSLLLPIHACLNAFCSAVSVPPLLSTGTASNAGSSPRVAVNVAVRPDSRLMSNLTRPPGFRPLRASLENATPSTDVITSSFSRPAANAGEPQGTSAVTLPEPSMTAPSQPVPGFRLRSVSPAGPRSFA